MPWAARLVSLQVNKISIGCLERFAFPVFLANFFLKFDLVLDGIEILKVNENAKNPELKINLLSAFNLWS